MAAAAVPLGVPDRRLFDPMVSSSGHIAFGRRRHYFLSTALAGYDRERDRSGCAARGTVAYVVDAADHEAYRLRIYATP